MHRAGGYLQIGRVHGVAIRLHWTTPIGLFFFGGFGFAPVAWAALLFIILVHEGGHAVLAHASGMYPTTIEVHGVGGRCTLRKAKAGPGSRRASRC